MADVIVKTYDSERRDIPALPLGAFSVTPSDSDNFTHPVTLEVHVAGALKVLPWHGDNLGAAEAITIPAGVAVLGYRTPFRVKRVYDTGTDATVIGIF